MIQEFLQAQRTSARAIILDILATVDVKNYLVTAGLTCGDVSEVRTRHLGTDA